MSPDPPIRGLARGERGYPTALNALEHPPKSIYVIGDPRILADAPDRVVAIVGTRDASPYGLRVARSLARTLAEAGAVVVSGMARGIDSAAHQAALEAGGRTVAVLGTGPDVPYPAGNRRLHRQVAERGLVLSESPPGTKAFRGCFPRRNRIIAALATATIVVEAGFKSGALNTTGLAAGLSRPVGAVPGPIDSPRSAGCNHLIRDGAQAIASPADALALAGLSRSTTVPVTDVGGNEAEVWSALAGRDLGADDIVELTGLPVRQALESIARLELMGLIRMTPAGRIGRVVIG